MAITRFSITITNGAHLFGDGMSAFKIDRVLVYDENGVVFTLPIRNLIGCMLELDGEIKIKKRKALDCLREEVQLIRSEKVRGSFDIYIPAAPLGVTRTDDFTRKSEDEEVVYLTYTINGSSLMTFTDGAYDLTQIDVDTIKVYDEIKRTKTKEFIKREKLSQDIEKYCGIGINAYALKVILKEFNITKKRKKLG